MAAAQNVRSGSSPGPTNDPDLWSRPPIQTFPRELIQTFDPDLWNDTIYGRIDVCNYSPSQAAKQQTVLKPRCQAVKLLSRTCCKATLLSSQAIKLLSSQAARVVKPRYHAVKLQLFSNNQTEQRSKPQLIVYIRGWTYRMVA